MPFELFTPSRTAPSEPFISLAKEGFRLSAGFVRKYRLERATAVRLYFDRAKRAVGFHFPTSGQPREGTLKPKRHAGGLVVRAEGFFRSRGIDPAVYAGRYQPREVKDRLLTRLFVIALRPQAVPQPKTSKARRRAA
jgi:hypothetical protein